MLSATGCSTDLQLRLLRELLAWKMRDSLGVSIRQKQQGKSRAISSRGQQAVEWPGWGMGAFSTWLIWRKATPPGASLAWCLRAQSAGELQRPRTPPSGQGLQSNSLGMEANTSSRHTGLLHGPCCMSPEGLHSNFSSVLCKKWTITVLSSCSLSPSHTNTSNTSRKRHRCHNRNSQQST